jgi:Ca2+-binding RTX toxin-like protein
MKFSLIVSLESRRLFASALPDDYAQYMVQLINRARANPTAEAARYGISLEEGLTGSEFISTTPKQPLAFNPSLEAAAQGQADWDLHDTTLQTFSHSGPGGDTPDQRAVAAGFALPAGASLTQENAAINLYNSLGSLTSLVTQQHQAYFVDTQNADGGRGHRIQMLVDQEKEVGAAILTGPYNYTDPNTHVTTTYQGFVSVIDFGYNNTVPYLTGVAYNDDVIQDQFYTPGEGLAGVNVVAIRTSDGKEFSTQTFSTGGYTLALEPGTYNIYGFGAGLGGFVSYGNVSVGNLNVEEDFQPQQVSDTNLPFTLLANGTLFVNGTAGDDAISITRSGSNYVVTRSGSSPQKPATFSASQVSSIQVDLGDGNDSFTAGPGVQAVYVNGGAGNDSISGGDGNDTLTGAAGKDRIDGNGGDDRINGGKGNDVITGGDGDDRLYGDDGSDKLFGMAGVDRLFGGTGNDYLSGGSSNDKIYGEAGNDSIDGDGQNDLLNGGDGNDTINGGPGNDEIVGGAGNDSLFGNAGNDTFDSVDGLVDTLDGGAGINTASMDANDIHTNIS